MKLQNVNCVFSLLLLVIAFALEVSDRTSAVIRASAPGVGYICSTTPVPYWTFGGCKCPIPEDPSDFCSAMLPPENPGTPPVPTVYRTVHYCKESSNNYSCDMVPKSCGDKIYKCTQAHCSNSNWTPPLEWGCSPDPTKPDGCKNLTYSWCDPVEIEEF
jgi:hypothetical protein